jgi:ribonuclease VapC
MVLDSSVLISILLNEPEVARYMSAIENADTLFISAVNLFETAMVIEGRKGKRGEQQFHLLSAKLAPEIIPFDASQAQLAHLAWQRYGKGNHSAKLNFGDCCAYALAKHFAQPLLYKGNDFSQTDIGSGID